MLTARLQRFGLVATLMVLPVSAVALVSWFFDDWRSLAFSPHYVPMAPVTAVLLAALAVTLLGQRWAPRNDAIRGLRQTSLALVVTIATLVLFQSSFGFALPWDRWLVTENAFLAGGIPAGRMSPTTAVAFLLCSLALSASQKRDDAASRTVAFSAGASLLIGLIVLAGYAIGTPFDYGSGRIPMALLTAFSFILISAGLLTQDGVLALARRRLGLADELSGAADRMFGLRLAAVLSALLFVIGFAGVSYVRHELDQVREALWRELDVVADQKAQELAQWREERVAEGRFLQRAPQITHDIRAFLAKPGDAAARARVVDWLEPIRGGDRYREALLFDAQGNPRLAIPERPLDANERIQPPSPGPPVLGPIQRSGEEGRDRLDLLVPLTEAGVGGVIVLRVDPSQHLFPLLARWSTRLQTAEATLARREGDEVVLLHTPRHSLGREPRLRFPVASPHLPSAMAARGVLGTHEGVDYQGEPVISSARIVPGSPWLLVAKIDQSEAYAPLRAEAWRSGLLLAAILFSTSLAAAHLWRDRHTATLGRALVVEKDRRALADRLGEARQTANRLSEAMDRIPAYIYMKDLDRRYTYANRPTLELFNRTAETLLGARDTDFFPAETVTTLHELDTRVLEGGVDTAEQVTISRPDGTRSIYWEIKTPIYEDASRLKIVGLCGISTDITNIRETEEALRESEKRHRLLADNATDVIWTTDTEGRFTYVSPSIEKRRGFTPAELMAQPFAASLTEASARLAETRYREVKERLASGRPFEPFTMEIEQPRKDGGTVWSETSVSGMVDAEGRFVGALGVSRDIGDRKRAQERLAAQLDELLRWQAAMLHREGRVQELKREVNDLSRQLGRKAPYLTQERAGLLGEADQEVT